MEKWMEIEVVNIFFKLSKGTKIISIEINGISLKY